MTGSDKESLRKKMLNWRDKQLEPSERDSKSQQICDRLLECTEVESADRLLGFTSINQEVRLLPFYRKLPRSVRIVLPRVHGRELVALEVPDRDELISNLEGNVSEGDFQRNEYNILEPVSERSTTVSPSELDLVLVPGLVFDLNGNRIGYGGGFYDRFLETLPVETLIIGVCFENQLVDEPLPMEPHDVAVDRVVTEEGMK